MVQDHKRNLKFDRRLLRRRGWIDAEELAKALADLPDVSNKAAPQGEEERDSPDGGEQLPEGGRQPG
jgi:hypothetical protein